MKQKKQFVHIGQIIQNYLKSDGHSVSWLARQIHCERTKIYRIFNSEVIDTGTLRRISEALKYDFFACLSNSLSENCR
ncbi:MAG: XRE family transcriptional regulator [Prevotellaceae bacterium]|nr:XRE family transcriptional regulator [Prevotellaceae bacterium]